MFNGLAGIVFMDLAQDNIKKLTDSAVRDDGTPLCEQLKPLVGFEEDSGSSRLARFIASPIFQRVHWILGHQRGQANV